MTLVGSRPKRQRGTNSLHVTVPAQTALTSQSLISPTYGKPTPDTHPLLNEDVVEPVDVILETRYVQSPQPKGNDDLKSVSGVTSCKTAQCHYVI